MLREILRIVRQGVPWNEAWALSRARRWAIIVALGEMDGGSFDWDAMRWREKTS